jgi:hypothetical protein
VSDKLIKTGVSIETAEAFAKAVGRAIADNDVESAGKLSGELRTRLEDAICACGHKRLAHSFMSNAELPNKPTGSCLATLPTLRQCTCAGYMPDVGLGAPALAVTTNVQPGKFSEGKHFAKLFGVSYERDNYNSVRPCIAFDMDIVESETMPLGRFTHRIATEPMTSLSVVTNTLERLGLRQAFTESGGAITCDLNIVVAAVWRNRMSMQREGSPRKWMSITLRRVDNTDERE